jgi:hypothetical protein
MVLGFKNTDYLLLQLLSFLQYRVACYYDFTAKFNFIFLF